MYLEKFLLVSRCPHCGIANPALREIYGTPTASHNDNHIRVWKVYVCNTCGGITTAYSYETGGEVEEIFPGNTEVDSSIPDKAQEYLRQALNSIHAPSGAIMLAASSVDAMLKEKNYKKGSLYSRINEAKKDHLITQEMSDWAHEVRLDANDERHADEEAIMPDEKAAQRVIDFTVALAQFLFVLPSKVKKGIADASLTENQD